MRRETGEWSVRMLADLRDRINVEAEYQRGIVWSKPQRLLLIDSILRGFDLPKIFLRKLPDGSDYLFDVIDGVQRLTSIWEFLSDELRLPRSSEYPTIGAIGGKTWSELPQDAKDRLQFAKITVSEIETEGEDEIRQLFRRLQEGEPLNAAEVRNAMDVPVRHFVAETLAKHELWQETGIRSTRRAWDELSAIVLALVVADGPTGLKGADLQALYEDTTFDEFGTVAQQTISLLTDLYNVASIERGRLRTRWGIVDLALSIKRLADDGIRPSPSAVMGFFVEFEAERQHVAAALSDLRSTIVGLATTDVEPDEHLILPEIAPEMLTYVNAFTREGATRDNVAARAEVMSSRLRSYLRQSQ